MVNPASTSGNDIIPSTDHLLNSTDNNCLISPNNKIINKTNHIVPFMNEETEYKILLKKHFTSIYNNKNNEIILSADPQSKG